MLKGKSDSGTSTTLHTGVPIDILLDPSAPDIRIPATTETLGEFNFLPTTAGTTYMIAGADTLSVGIGMVAAPFITNQLGIDPTENPTTFHATLFGAFHTSYSFAGGLIDTVIHSSAQRFAISKGHELLLTQSFPKAFAYNAAHRFTNIRGLPQGIVMSTVAHEVGRGTASLVTDNPMIQTVAGMWNVLATVFISGVEGAQMAEAFTNPGVIGLLAFGGAYHAVAAYDKSERAEGEDTRSQRLREIAEDELSWGTPVDLVGPTCILGGIWTMGLCAHSAATKIEEGRWQLPLTRALMTLGFLDSTARQYYSDVAEAIVQERIQLIRVRDSI